MTRPWYSGYKMWDIRYGKKKKPNRTCSGKKKKEKAQTLKQEWEKTDIRYITVQMPDKSRRRKKGKKKSK